MIAPRPREFIRGETPWLDIGVELGVLFYASWTLAYQITLLSRLPAACVPLVALGCAAAAGWAYRRFRRGQPSQLIGTQAAMSVSVLALVASIGTLFLLRPDADDFSFFHRALVQLGQQGAPLIVHDTSHDLAGLPPISLLHISTSYEWLAALTAQWAGVHPTWWVQNMAALLATAFMLLVYALWLRDLGVAARWIPLGTLGVVTFLALDGNLHRSFGSFTLARLWQGKTILVGIYLPLATLYTARWCALGRRADLFVLSGVTLGGIGLSGSAVPLMPAMVAVTAAASLSLSCGTLSCAQAGKRLLFLAAPLAYPLAVGALLTSGAMAQPTSVAVWRGDWPEQWWANVALVLQDRETVVRNGLLLLALPWLALDRRRALFVLGLSLAAASLFLNPLSGPVWIDIMLPASSWRLVYLLPLPLCAGLAVVGAVTLPRSRRWLGGSAVVVGCLVASVLAFRQPALGGASAGGPFKRVGQMKLVPAHAQLATALLPQLAGKRVLVPPYLAVPLGLLDPTVKFYVNRPQQTAHIFAAAGLAEEGRSRVQASHYISRCPRPPAAQDALRRALTAGVEAIVLRRCSTPAVDLKQAIQASGVAFAPATGYHGHDLWMRRARKQ